jgi:hypothetical protein
MHHATQHHTQAAYNDTGMSGWTDCKSQEPKMQDATMPGWQYYSTQ